MSDQDQFKDVEYNLATAKDMQRRYSKDPFMLPTTVSREQYIDDVQFLLDWIKNHEERVGRPPGM